MPKDLKNRPIPVNAPVISEEAKRYVRDSLETGWLSASGPYVAKFEQAFASYLGMKHGVAVANGTAALHSALLALGIGAGDEVIVPAFTMIAPVFAVMYTGARPLFVDSERETFNIDVTRIESKITSKTRVILAVHIFGHPCEMDAIREIAKRRGLRVIEDAAEAHGALYRGHLCGSMSDISCFSFYANKVVTTGEGGMALTQDDALARRLRKFRDLCHSDEKRFIHEDLGYNYRLTNVQAAIGLGELENIDRYVARKRAIAARYDAGLRHVPGIRTPITRPHARSVFWMYGILVDEKAYGRSKDGLRRALAERSIETRDFFYPPEDQPALTRRLGDVGCHPHAAYLAKTGCYLPSGLAITDEEIDRVAEAVRDLAGHAG
jgi:perosamine synthetase